MTPEDKSDCIDYLKAAYNHTRALDVPTDQISHSARIEVNILRALECLGVNVRDEKGELVKELVESERR